MDPEIIIYDYKSFPEEMSQGGNGTEKWGDYWYSVRDSQEIWSVPNLRIVPPRNKASGAPVIATCHLPVKPHAYKDANSQVILFSIHTADEASHSPWVAFQKERVTGTCCWEQTLTEALGVHKMLKRKPSGSGKSTHMVVSCT